MKRRPETAAHRDMRLDFYADVLGKGPCYWRQFIPHECDGPLDPMHIIPKQFLKNHFFREDPDDIAAIIYDPDNGVPGCRAIHGQIDSRFHRIYREWLPPETIAFAGYYDLGWWLDAHIPSLEGDAA